MAERWQRNRWVAHELLLRDLDAERARDLVIECFLEAQQETFARVKEKLGVPVDREQLQRSVVGAVRAAFEKTGGDFDAPTRESIERAIGSLARTAAATGTPADIIDHHRAQIERVLARLDA